MGGVSNRLAYVSQDGRLRDIFNNTDQEFDFRDVLDDDTVVIFDLGDLRAEPTKLLSGLILSNLEDALREQADEVSAKPEEYVVNLLVDEAASVVTSDIMNRLLEQGRGFRLSVGLSMQFPEQIEEEGGRRLYLNALNNIGTTLVGQISVDREIAEAMAHEDMSPREFKDRIASLPRGEWIVQVPSPTFGESGPKPFSVDPLPIPAGHPESDDPLTGREADRVEKVIDRVQNRTNEEFGVPEPEPEPRDSPDDVQERLGTRNEDLDQALAKVVRTIQLRHGVREENGEVPVEEVDDELRELFTDVDDDVEPPTYDELGAVRERSQLLAVEIDTEADQLVISLTERGEEAVEPDTGDVRSAGKDGHDDAIFATEEALVNAGFEVTIVTQDGSEQPDALATHPDHADQFAVEVETTTPDKPNKILANLRKAQQADQIPLFVVEPGETETYWADRVASILESPIKREDEGDRVFYTLDTGLRITDRRTDDDPIAVRPVVGEDDSRRTVWIERDDAYVLTDGTGTEHARIEDVSSVTGRQFPGIVTYDETANEYIVDTETDRRIYESKEAFQSDWVTVKQPIVPERVLPNPGYGDETYAIVILYPDGESVLYDADRSTSPLATIADRSLRLPTTPASDNSDVHDQPRDTEADEENTDESVIAGDDGLEQQSTPESTASEAEETDSSPAETTTPDHRAGESFEEYVETYISENAEAVVSKDAVYRVYTIWAAQHGHDVENKVWLSRRLSEVVDFDTSRRRIDGDRIQCCTGIELTATARELIE